MVCPQDRLPCVRHLQEGSTCSEDCLFRAQKETGTRDIRPIDLFPRQSKLFYPSRPCPVWRNHVDLNAIDRKVDRNTSRCLRKRSLTGRI
jgi:hypothetical protein